MDQAYPDITPEVKERLHKQGLKPYKLQPLIDFYNPHTDWATNFFLTGLILIGRYYAVKNQSVVYLWTIAGLTIPLLAIGSMVKLEGVVTNGGHRRTLEEKLDYSPITRRAWYRALEENNKYVEQLENEIRDLEYKTLKN